MVCWLHGYIETRSTQLRNSAYWIQEHKVAGHRNTAYRIQGHKLLVIGTRPTGYRNMSCWSQEHGLLDTGT